MDTMTFERITKQKKIGILRTDNHSLLYAACMSNYDRYQLLLASGQLYILENETLPVIPFRDTTVTGCWCGAVPENKAWTPELFAKAFNCKMYDRMEDMADPALFDGMVLGNCNYDASDHVEITLPFIEKGIPMFIDKPFANNAKNAAIILNAAKKYNTPIFCSSILLYDIMNKKLLKKNLGNPSLVVSTFSSGIESRPASVHTISACLGAVRFLKGDYAVDSMTYIGNKTGDRKNEMYRLLFKDGTIGIINCETFGTYAFHVEVFADNGISSEYTTEPTMRTGIIDIAEAFDKMIDTRVPPLHYDRIFEFVATIDAAIRSRDEGGRPVTIAEIADEAGWKLSDGSENTVK